MSNYWSNYIQTSEELYNNRSLRFNDNNKEMWLNAIGVRNQQNILEVGCGGGVFCHRINSYVGDVHITGIDCDEQHIQYAKDKNLELGLNCKFIVGDATNMPFEDNSFDLCFSHTVAEHVPHKLFFDEQYRILRNNGRIVVLSVRPKLQIRYDNLLNISKEEKLLCEKAFKNTDDIFEKFDIGKFEVDEHEYPKELEKAGFRNINVDLLNIMSYAPDNYNTSPITAINQINDNRLEALSGVYKVLNLSPNSLTIEEKDRLIELINIRFDKRIEQYKNNEKIWDFKTTAVLVISGYK
ncbi:class I SAM-dependent methyltransferase [Sedimentibacter sp. zth1]|uniref:class I SAM-dependent methyltransferase n=1 Tax=Sedimentibacter sp. zth1 TaxID=2816908 RepID=UPI001A912A4A|nr:class I SAM-dependent methyltransferase [Sedimentibacter sp. zth1]QSX06939.1 class I SAM-dependent methyltransferase [Sedimentibacter sp. zth1]